MTPASFREQLNDMGISQPGASTYYTARAFAGLLKHLGDERRMSTISRQVERWLLGEGTNLPGWLPAMLTLMNSWSETRRGDTS